LDKDGPTALLVVPYSSMVACMNSAPAAIFTAPAGMLKTGPSNFRLASCKPCSELEKLPPSFRLLMTCCDVRLPAPAGAQTSSALFVFRARVPG
jgi:hypothetical protein